MHEQADVNKLRNFERVEMSPGLRLTSIRFHACSPGFLPQVRHYLLEQLGIDHARRQRVLLGADVLDAALCVNVLPPQRSLVDILSTDELPFPVKTQGMPQLPSNGLATVAMDCIVPALRPFKHYVRCYFVFVHRQRITRHYFGIMMA